MGKFVVVSGLPASGKSTLIKALKEKGLIERAGSDKAGDWKVL